MRTHKMYFRISVVTLVTVVSIFACQKESDTDPFTSYDRKAMLSNLGNNLVIPSFQTFQMSAQQLKVASENFVKAPSAANLTQVQEAWRTAATVWKRAEVYKMGPVEDQFLGVAIEYYPVNASGIENAINGSNTINSDYVESKASSVKGLSALEYLLFDRENGNEAVLTKFADGAAANRRAYLLALTENLQAKAGAVVSAWQNEYLTKFINADGRDISSSLGLLTNEMVLLMENVKNNKLGVPLGKMGNGTLQPSTVEAGRSESSVSHIKNNLQALENTFLGRTSTGQDGPGYDDLLDAMNAQYDGQLLSSVIKAKFTEAMTKVNAINSPMQQAVVQQTQTVESAYNTSKELVILLKVDMTNNLGVLITFSDNDGD